ncbi:MAG: AbrB/MazE/SpoVT family DNA-binding domain-containing protein [Nitrososphaeria archaeon]
MAETVVVYAYKIRRIGGSFTVTLPAAWIRAHNLNAGDKVFLAVHSDGSITLDVAKWKGGRAAPFAGLEGLKAETGRGGDA